MYILFEIELISRINQLLDIDNGALSVKQSRQLSGSRMRVLISKNWV